METGCDGPLFLPPHLIPHVLTHFLHTTPTFLFSALPPHLPPWGWGGSGHHCHTPLPHTWRNLCTHLHTCTCNFTVLRQWQWQWQICLCTTLPLPTTTTSWVYLPLPPDPFPIPIPIPIQSIPETLHLIQDPILKGEGWGQADRTGKQDNDIIPQD